MSKNRSLIEVRESSIQGRGVFATRRIREGTRIIEYVGQRITQAQADARYDDDAMERTHTFLFTVDDDEVIDAAFDGNDARFINHCCEPNCESVLDDGRIYIEAIRNIQPGAELSYDYRLERGPDVSPEWLARYACNCGAASCRGTLLYLPRKRKKAKTAAGAKQRRSELTRAS